MSKSSQERIGEVGSICCARCKSFTKHTIRGAYDTAWDDDESGVSEAVRHDLLSCNGCDAVTYRADSWFSEEPGERSITLYPPRGANAPRAPRSYEYLPYGSPLESVYRQTVTALNHQLATLTAAGVRLMIEGVCNDRGIVDGNVIDPNGTTARKCNLEGRINGLAEQGLISVSQAGILHQIRLLGNDAAHALDQPSRAVLESALDILEHLLAQLYEHPEHAQRLSGRRRPGGP